jgi:sialate O-acetylesterase
MSLKVSSLLSCGMVIQQGVPIPIEGEAEPGAEAAVLFHGKTYRARAGESGAWRVLLDSCNPGGPYTMEISAIGKDSAESLVIEDIFIGDVWLCSGQSNMEMSMEGLKDDFPKEWKTQGFPPIRQFKVPQEWDFSGPRKDLAGGSWLAASKETLHEFSGTAWFFAKTIFEKHRTPIGLVNASWGGTPAEAWMSREALAEFPAAVAAGGQYADPALRAKMTARNAAEIQAWEDGLLRDDRGLAEKWYKPQTDIGGWDEISLPGIFAQGFLSRENPLAAFCGVIWLAREFDAGKNLASAHDAQLWIGTLVDADIVYINGVEVGNTDNRYPPRKYGIPQGLLREGNNRIVIRVSCANGEGGITHDKPFRIFTNGETIELAGTWKCRIGAYAGRPRPEEFFFQRQPMGLFNAMIAPVLQYPFKGVIWYQGESNDQNSCDYAALFKALIQDWRERSGRGDFPFLFVQLPIWGSPSDNDETASWAIIREAQKDALSLPATGMAVGLELGEWNDIHPVNKKDIGCRLALAAEQVVYGNNNTSPGPLLRSIQRRQNFLIISFTHCGAGLSARGQAFVSVLAGGAPYRLPAEIEGPDSISIDISSIEDKKPEKVLYAWAANPRDRQLYNSDGLPVIPFNEVIVESDFICS